MVAAGGRATIAAAALGIVAIAVIVSAPNSGPPISGVSPSRIASPASSLAPPSVAATPDPTAPADPPIEVIFDVGTDTTLSNVAGVVRHGDGLVVAVNVQEGCCVPVTPGLPTSGAIYVQVGSTEWELVDTGDTFEDAEISHLFAPLGRPMIAFGDIFDPQATRPDEGAWAWTSDDGTIWTRIPGPVPCTFTVTHGASGYACAFTGRSGTAPSAIYLSDDAFEWRLAYEAPPDMELVSVGSGPEGFVAVGYQGEPAAQHLIAIASSDGDTWHQAPDLATETERQQWAVDAVAPIGPDWVAVGGRFTGSSPGDHRGWPIARRSANGLDWGPPTDLPDEGSAVASEIRAGAGHVFMSVAFPAEGTRTRPRGVWESTDGISWRRLDLGAEAEVHVVLEDEGALLLGGRSADDAGHAVIWRVTPEWFAAP